MATTVRMLTTGPMKAATIVSHTSEATGYEAEYLLDNNPDTYWKASSDASQQIVIDLGSSIAVAAAVIWIHNYTGITHTRSDPANTPDMYVYGSTDNVNWSNALWSWGATGSTSVLISSAGPIRLPLVANITAQTAYRYYKLIVVEDENGSEVIELSGFWLCRAYIPTIGNQYPQGDVDIFRNRYDEAEGGRSFVTGINSSRGYRFSRTFLFGTQADEDALRGAFNDCCGRRYPLFLYESTTQTDAVMCRFYEDEYNRQMIGYGQYNPTVQFQSVPWIPAGESY